MYEGVIVFRGKFGPNVGKIHAINSWFAICALLFAYAFRLALNARCLHMYPVISPYNYDCSSF